MLKHLGEEVPEDSYVWGEIWHCQAATQSDHLHLVKKPFDTCYIEAIS